MITGSFMLFFSENTLYLLFLIVAFVINMQAYHKLELWVGDVSWVLKLGSFCLSTHCFEGLAKTVLCIKSMTCVRSFLK